MRGGRRAVVSSTWYQWVRLSAIQLWHSLPVHSLPRPRLIAAGRQALQVEPVGLFETRAGESRQTVSEVLYGFTATRSHSIFEEAADRSGRSTHFARNDDARCASHQDRGGGRSRPIRREMRLANEGAARLANERAHRADV